MTQNMNTVANGNNAVAAVDAFTLFNNIMDKAALEPSRIVSSFFNEITKKDRNLLARKIFHNIGVGYLESSVELSGNRRFIVSKRRNRITLRKQGGKISFSTDEISVVKAIVLIKEIEMTSWMSDHYDDLKNELIKLVEDKFTIEVLD